MKLLKTTLAALLAVTSFNVNAGKITDDPLLTYVRADRFEIRDSDEGNILVMEFDAWIGKDLNKAWLKFSRASIGSKVEGSKLDLVYSKAVAPYWDLQYGMRQVIDPQSETWLGVGFMGVAPYLFEVDANVFVNSENNINFRLDAEYEYMLTQKYILVPSLEASIYSKDDNAKGIVSGLASIELGLRLQYMIKRELMPYIGINYEKGFGNDVIQASSETQLVAGVSFWF